MIQILYGNKEILYRAITSLGLFCLNASDFFVACNSIIRNKSPPLYNRNFKEIRLLEVNNERKYKKL